MMNLMPHPPRSLRPLLFPFELSRFFSFSFPLFSKRHSRALSRFNVLPSSASSSYSKRRNIEDQGYSINTVRRTRENLKEDKNRDKGTMMEQALSSSSSAASRSSSSFEFNKRRAEGNDRSEKLKRIPQRKFRELNPSNTIAYVQILGTGMDTQDTSPSVLLFFDKQRFIFNAGEGLQRFCTEHKIRLSKIDHIFLSRVCTETAGGLPGLLLTLAGIGDEGLSVNVWGPSDLKFLVDAMRSFIPRAAMVHTHSFGSDLNKPGDPIVLVDDIVVKISATVIQPHSTEGSEVKPGEMSVIYLCELPEIMGKFDPKKAMALGLRPGPKYSELQSGKSVKSDHKDIMVHPSDVLGPSSPGPIVLLVDCPTSSHAEELMMVESLNHYYSNPDNPTEGKKIVNCIIHLSPDSVISSPTYQSWMKRFGLAQHIIAGHQKKNMEIPILNTSSRIAARLNYLCPQLFPFTGFWSPQIISESSSDSNISEGIRAENLLKFTLRPHASLGPDRSLIPRTLTHVQAIDDLLLEIKDITKAAEDVKQLWSGQDGRQIMTEKPSLSKKSLPNCLENIRRDDMEMAFLGTGSSKPSNYRNVSSIYINLFSKGSLLLDCGEGTLGQLKRRYGVEGADDAVRNLSCIWISHIHADHHSGLARILALRRDLLKDVHHEPILVVGPRQLKRYLDAYQRLEDLDMEYLDCRYTTEASWASFECETDPKHNDKYNNNNDDNSRSTEGTLFAEGSAMQSVWKRPRNQVENFSASPYLKKLKRVLAEAGLETLVSFPVVHCPQSFGAILKAKERLNSLGKKIPGWKIVYSGDTRPCPEIIQASRGATALIHEATFEDGLVEEAVAKNHSTTKEAMEVGSSAGVYRIILTHFSQRYPKIPVIDESHMHNTCIAFDFMSINMADLPVLPQVVPYFKILFRNEMVEDESDSVMDTTEAL